MNSSPRRQFHKYMNGFLCESGSYLGEGIQDALNCGFKQVISFEVKEDLYKQCVEKFKTFKNVKVIYGSTARILYEYIKDINEPITFWLDGHYSSGITGYDPDHVCPLLEELDQIKMHPIKTHTIMIDDRRLLKKSSNNGMDGLFGIEEATVIKKLKEINPDYNIKYENGHIPSDIIVAKLNFGKNE